MMRVRRVVLFSALALLGGCTVPPVQMPAMPIYPGVPSPPQTPDLRIVPSEYRPAEDAAVFGSASVDRRRDRMGVLTAVGLLRTSALHDRIVEALLLAGVSEVVDLAPADAVLSARETSSRNGSAWIAGRLSETARLAPTTGVDVLLLVHEFELTPVTREVPVVYSYDPAALASYDRQSAAYRAEADTAREAIDAVRDGYLVECEAVRSEWLENKPRWMSLIGRDVPPELGECEQARRQIAERERALNRSVRTGDELASLIPEAGSSSVEMLAGVATVDVIEPETAQVRLRIRVSVEGVDSSVVATRLAERVVEEVLR